MRIRSALFLLLIASSLSIAPVRAQSGAPAAAVSAGSPAQITAVEDKTGTTHSPSIAIDGEVAVLINLKPPVDVSNYVLFLNGIAFDDLTDTYYDANLKALVFHLVRNDKNIASWKALLGSSSMISLYNGLPVTVALGQRATDGQLTRPTITGVNHSAATFTFQVLTLARLLFALTAVLIMMALIWGGASRTAILKDNLIPQIDPRRQTYSLGRTQMAFWFSLIFSSYVFLYILLFDPNTLSPQALMLMGISGATALAAVTVDAIKDSPQDAANCGLRLLGINSYADVKRLRAEIADRQQQLTSTINPPSTVTIAQLQSEISDRQFKLRNYEDAIAPFVSEGWFKDIVTDNNGTALHRLQVVCWTALLGVVFLIGVWRDLAMPQFDGTLLALMAVSGAGYVGFKYPEAQQ